MGLSSSHLLLAFGGLLPTASSIASILDRARGEWEYDAPTHSYHVAPTYHTPGHTPGRHGNTHDDQIGDEAMVHWAFAGDDQVKLGSLNVFQPPSRPEPRYSFRARLEQRHRSYVYSAPKPNPAVEKPKSLSSTKASSVLF
ncbi:hypothetical protein HO173_008256 [Letharia columbiana]|uniref:Uncharacterized protein n=1 Tax=Letharia columbiana TaxID=112416 RepID=A0A8H6FRY5_9LECA|nr:uncharacterized protein HO173_008256 [Letharia columbiana]KAF6233525.1 hypothetical protein HO173_008256 [Letharia columbiana]